jgi:hypothetical protein
VVLGIGLALVALAAAAWGFAWLRYGDVDERTSREVSDVRDRFAAEVDVPGEVAVDLDAGRQLVYVVVPRGTGTRDEEYDLDLAADELAVELTTPDGDPIAAAAPDPEAPSTDVFGGHRAGFELVLVAEYVVPTGGQHVLTVEGESSEGVTTAGIVEAVGRHAGADATLVGGVLFVLGLLVGGVGVVVALAGGAWLLGARAAPRR